MKKCSICKGMKPNKEVRLRENPYRAELNGDYTKVKICDDCIEILKDEI